jgi:hypothetical protein
VRRAWQQQQQQQRPGEQAANSTRRLQS